MSGSGLIDKIKMLPLEERKARKLAGEKAKVEKLLGERRPKQKDRVSCRLRHLSNRPRCSRPGGFAMTRFHRVRCFR